MEITSSSRPLPTRPSFTFLIDPVVVATMAALFTSFLAKAAIRTATAFPTKPLLCQPTELCVKCPFISPIAERLT